MYNPLLGSWVSRDPLGLAGGDPNLSRYVDNNPPNNVDPSGLQHHGPHMSLPGKYVPPPPLPLPPSDRPKLPHHHDPEYQRDGRYYPPQSRIPNLKKVALISNMTCDSDTFDWIPANQQHKDIGSYKDVVRALMWYADDSIDVLVISGDTGGQCSAAMKRSVETSETLGGWRMPAHINTLISSTVPVVAAG